MIKIVLLSDNAQFTSFGQGKSIIGVQKTIIKGIIGHYHSERIYILRHFRIFFNLGAILVHQTSNGMFSRSWRIFWHPWHPWHPWGLVNSGDISFLVFVFDFSVWQHHLADFFHYSKIEARCHLYWFDRYKSDKITFYSQNGWIFKVIQAVSVVIWMEFIVWKCVWRVEKNPITIKVLKCLNQCFARLRSWKSVSSKTAVDPSSRFCEFETLFQHRSCAKHWFKNSKILVSLLVY
jgi:hypothetical protein